MHPAIIIGTVRSLWTWLWGRYHVPQNVFLVVVIITMIISIIFIFIISNCIQQRTLPVTYSNTLGMYWIQVFEMRLEMDLDGYPLVYPARHGTRQCDDCSIALHVGDEQLGPDFQKILRQT